MRIFVYILVSCFLATSCQETTVVPVDEFRGVISTFDYYKSIRSETDGKLFVINSLANFGYNGANVPKTYIRSNHNSNSFMGSVQGFRLNEHEFHFENPVGANVVPPKVELETLYGNPLELSFGEEKTVEILVDYVPEPIRLNVTEYPMNISEGSTLDWNEDRNNNNPILILLTYSPLDNPGLSADYPDSIVEYAYVSDNGQYSFRNTDFSQVPRGSVCVLSVIRGLGEVTDVNVGTSSSSLSFVISSITEGFVNFY